MPPAPGSTPEASGSSGASPAPGTFRASLSASGVAAALADARGAIRWANESLAALYLGAGLGQAQGRGLEEIFGPAEEGGIRALGPKRERFFRHIQAPVRGVAGGRAGDTVHLLVECTAEVRRERQRREREFYLSRAVDDTLDAVVSLDTTGRIRYWNRGAERMFGYLSEEVIGHPYDLLVPEALRQEGELDRIAEILERQGVLRNFETVRLARGGRQVEVDITITRMQEDDGAVLGRSVIYRDISIRRRLEAQVRENLARLEAFKIELSRKVDELRTANSKLRRNQEKLLAVEKLSAVGEMAARVAHEIRTPLVTIGGFSHTVWKTLPEDAPEREYLGIIREEVRRLELIVSEILDYVKPGRLDTMPCDVNAMVEEALRPHVQHIEQEGIVLEKRLAQALPPAHVDRYQIHQVLTNLIINAIQALEYVPRAGRRLTVMTQPGENHVKIAIADSGPGIPERHRSRIFRPFFTTKPAGSGLGLAISAQIVAQHQATLNFDTAEGGGTTFDLCLPTAPPERRGEGAPQ